MTMHNKSGFTLIGLMIAIVITAVVVTVAYQGFSQSMRTQKQVENNRDARRELGRALADILRVGRIAQACTCIVGNLGTPPAPACEWLECRVDRNIPPTATAADDTTFRFGFVGGQLKWLRKEGTVFVVHQEYDAVTNFEVCDDFFMANGCSLSSYSSAITATHLANRAAASFPTPANRFFRVGLSHVGKTNQKIQSAFWVRHPTSSGLLYQWGQHWDE